MTSSTHRNTETKFERKQGKTDHNISKIRTPQTQTVSSRQQRSSKWLQDDTIELDSYPSDLQSASPSLTGGEITPWHRSRPHRESTITTLSPLDHSKRCSRRRNAPSLTITNETQKTRNKLKQDTRVSGGPLAARRGAPTGKKDLRSEEKRRTAQESGEGLVQKRQNTFKMAQFLKTISHTSSDRI